jgi:hypothetical protein
MIMNEFERFPFPILKKLGLFIFRTVLFRLHWQQQDNTTHHPETIGFL